MNYKDLKSTAWMLNELLWHGSYVIEAYEERHFNVMKVYKLLKEGYIQVTPTDCWEEHYQFAYDIKNNEVIFRSWLNDMTSPSEWR